MMNVLVATISLVIALLSAGCAVPDVEVGSLGKKFPAPTLKNSNLLIQDSFEDQGYLRIQGACDARVGDVFVSFDKINWYQPRSSPNITGTNLSASLVNDRNCADKAFDIYITNLDLAAWNVAASSVQEVYVKGETLIGDTELLTVVKVAATPDIISYAITGASTMEAGQCYPQTLERKNQNGILTAPLTNLTAVLESSTFGSGDFFLDANCQNAITQKTMSPSQSSISFYFKPKIAPPTTYAFNLQIEGGLESKNFVLTLPAAKFKIQSPTASSACQPLAISIVDFYGNASASPSGASPGFALKKTVLGIPSNRTVYSDYICSMAITSGQLYFAPGQGTVTVYAETSNLLGEYTLTVSPTSSPPLSGDSLSY